MFAVILVAGKGGRMGEITQTIPKPLLKKDGKTLLEYKFEALPSSITDVILVIGHLGTQFINEFGYSYTFQEERDRMIKIHYVYQNEPRGTADALWQAKDILMKESPNESFIVLMGDDIYDKNDIQKLGEEECAVLHIHADPSMKYGKSITSVVTNTETSETYEILEDIIIDQTKSLPGGLVTGAYSLPLQIFEQEQVLVPGTPEYGLPQTVLGLKKTFPIKVIYTNKWIRITKPEDLLQDLV